MAAKKNKDGLIGGSEVSVTDHSRITREKQKKARVISESKKLVEANELAEKSE